MADFTVEGIITVDSAKAIRNLTVFQTKLKSVGRDVKALDRAIDKVDGRTIRINVDDSPIKKLKTELDTIRDEKVKVKAEADTKEALTDVEKLAAEIHAITDHDVKTKVILAGGAKAIASAEKLHAELEAASRPVDIPVHYDRKPLRELMKDVNSAKSGIGGPSAGMGTLIGAIMAIVPALAPIGAVAAGALGGLISSIAVSTAGVAGFGIVAIPTFKKIAGGIELLNTNTSDLSPEKLKEYNAEVAKFKKTNPLIWKATQGFKELKKSYMELNKAIEPSVLKIFTNMLKIGNTLLQSLTPMIKKSGTALANLSSDMSKSLKGEEWQKFFKYLNKNSSKFITVWGKATGNFITGIANMIRAFHPLTKWFNKGLLGMSRDFRKWSDNLGKSEGFKNFVKYVKENGPRVKRLLGNLIMVFIDLGRGLAKIGPDVIDVTNKMIEKFRKLVKMNPKLTGLVTVFGGLALMVAPLIGPLTAIGGPIVTLLTALGAAGAVAVGVVALAGGVAALGAALAFSNKETPEYTTMMGKITDLWDKLKKTGSDLSDTFKDIWENLNDSTAVTDFQEAFGNIASIIGKLLPVLDPLAQLLGFLLVPALDAFAKSLNDVTAGLDMALSIITTAVNGIVTAFKWLYDKLIGNSIIPDLVNGIRDWFGKIPGFIMGAVNKAKGKVVDAFNFMKNKIIGIGSSIVGAVKDKFNAARSAVGGAVDKAKGYVSDKFSSIVSTVKGAGSKVLSTVTDKFNSAKNAVSTKTSDMYTSAKKKFSDIVSSAGSVLGRVKGAVTGAFSGAIGWLSSAGSNIMGGLIGGISAGIDRVKGMLQGVTNLIPSWKGPKSKDKRLLRPTGHWIMQGLKKGLDEGSSNIKKLLTDLTHKIAKFYKKKFKSGKASALYTKSALKLMDDQYKKMMDAGKVQDKLNDKVAKATANLKELIKARKQYVAQVKAGVVSTGDVSSIGVSSDGSRSPSSIVDALKSKVADATKFTALIQKLKDDNLNKQSLQDLINAGVEGGLSAAQAIANGGASTIGEVNDLMNQLKEQGQLFGNIAGDEMYQNGIQAAQGLLDGLKSQDKALKKYIKLLGRNLADMVDIILGPGGKKKKRKRIAAAINDSMNSVSQNENKKQADKQKDKNGTNTSSGNREYKIEIKALAPNAEVGRAVVKAIEEFERSGGRKKK